MRNLSLQNIMVFLLFCSIGSIFVLGNLNGISIAKQEKLKDIKSIDDILMIEPSIPEPFPHPKDRGCIMGSVIDASTREGIRATIEIYNRQGSVIGEAISYLFDGNYFFTYSTNPDFGIEPYYVIASQEGYITSSPKYISSYTMFPTIFGNTYTINFYLQPI